MLLSSWVERIYPPFTNHGEWIIMSLTVFHPILFIFKEIQYQKFRALANRRVIKSNCFLLFYRIEHAFSNNLSRIHFKLHNPKKVFNSKKLKWRKFCTRFIASWNDFSIYMNLITVQQDLRHGFQITIKNKL